MKTLRRYLWIGALAFSLAFLALGSFFVVAGQNAKAQVRVALVEEQITTGADAEKWFGVKQGTLVSDAKTAQAQADTIKEHSRAIKGAVLTSGQPTTLTYAQMKSNLFVSPEAYNSARSTYVTGTALRAGLGLGVLGFGVANLAIGMGAMVILAGVLTGVVGVPALYWAKQAEGEVAQEVVRRVARAPATEAAL